MNHTNLYKEVIASKRWRALKKRLIDVRGYRCEHCKITGRDLSLHHKTYDRLGQERDTDLELLCVYCHGKADKKRAIQTEKNYYSARYSARLDGFASRIWGPYWEDHISYEYASERFDDWIQSRLDRGLD